MQTSRWIRWLRQSPTSDRVLILFPPAGGASSMFRPWLALIPKEISVAAVVPPGREHRFNELPVGSIGDAVCGIANELEHLARGKYVLYGHSLGALLAFETTKEMRSRRLRLPQALVVSSCHAPHHRSAAIMNSGMSEVDFIQHLGRLEGTPPEVLNNVELMRLVLPAMRADFALLESYRYSSGAPLEIPIVAIGGVEDEDIRVESLRHWKDQTSNSFQLHALEGGHFFFRPDPTRHLELVLAELLAPSL